MPFFLFLAFLIFIFGAQTVFAQELSLFDSQFYQTETELNGIEPGNVFLLEIEKGIIKSNNFLQGEINLPQEEQEKPKKEIIRYIVAQGDTLSEIANKFGLKTTTLLWLNNLEETSIIKPGEVVQIPPIDGILYTVKKGDTLSEIAQTYKSDIEKIISFNEIDPEMIIEGQKLFLPDGIKPPAPKKPSLSITSKNSFSMGKKFFQKKGNCNNFPYGYCTWYLAQKRCITWRGHAKSWIYNAKAQGYRVCFGANCKPRPGAIMVTNENGFWGHVGYVEKVNQNEILISEMNFIGWGKISFRTFYRGDSRIKGYIYSY